MLTGLTARTSNTLYPSEGKINEFQWINFLCSSAQDTDSWWEACDWSILSHEPDVWLKEGSSPRLQSQQTTLHGEEISPQKRHSLCRRVARKLTSNHNNLFTQPSLKEEAGGGFTIHKKYSQKTWYSVIDHIGSSVKNRRGTPLKYILQAIIQQYQVVLGNKLAWYVLWLVHLSPKSVLLWK